LKLKLPFSQREKVARAAPTDRTVHEVYTVRYAMLETDEGASHKTQTPTPRACFTRQGLAWLESLLRIRKVAAHETSLFASRANSAGHARRTWVRGVHLRICLVCGHVGCCDSSKNKHATAHFHATSHPLVQSMEPGEDWLYCYVDNVMLEPETGPMWQGTWRKP
jgi:Zn-finger in ubiquitin-hydrolases and other protein